MRNWVLKAENIIYLCCLGILGAFNAFISETTGNDRREMGNNMQHGLNPEPLRFRADTLNPQATRVHHILHFSSTHINYVLQCVRPFYIGTMCETQKCH